MVCANCGSLNEGTLEKCIRCGRPLSATDEQACAFHSDQPAVTQCSLCGRPLCESCRVLVAGSTYCPEDAESLMRQPSEQKLEASPVLKVTERDPATPGQRLQSGLVDVGLVFVSGFILYLLLWVIVGDVPSEEHAGALLTIYWLLLLVGSWAYLVAGGMGGQTLGMSSAGTLVLREDGCLLDLTTSAIRSALAIVGLLALGAGYWPIVWRPDRRALHDLATHTLVVQE